MKKIPSSISRTSMVITIVSRAGWSDSTGWPPSTFRATWAGEGRMRGPGRSSRPSPAQVARKVLGGHPVESDHPALETIVITIDVLDMEDGIFFMDVFVGKDQFKGDFLLIDEPPQRIASIDAQDVISPQSTAQDLFDCGFGLIWQNGIDHRAMSVPGHQNRDLFAGESALLCLAATFSGWTGKLAAPLEGFKKIGFIRFGDAFKFDGFVGCRSLE